MLSSDGRHVIVFNGEIYNFLELRRELEAQGAIFRTQSDTEVILAAWRAWREGMLSRFNGMWALAIYDTQTKRTVSRARPLRHQAASLCDVAGAVYFRIGAAGPGASGLIATSVDVDVARRLMLDAFGVEGSERTLCKEVRRLQGGHCMWLRQGRLEVRRWWRTHGSFARGAKHRSRACGALPRAVSGCRRAADAQRRADRDLPVGRIRFIRGDLHHGGTRNGRNGTARQHRLAPCLRRDISGRIER